MYDFDYVRAESVGRANELLEEHSGRAKILAGGTDLIIQLREEDESLRDIRMIVDISSIEELKYIREDDDEIRIGTLTTHAEIANSKLIKEKVSFLAEAARQVGGPQIRHAGTIGGNIGNASPAADTIIPLIALDAEVVIANSTGERRLLITEIIDRPYGTTLKDGELMTEIVFKTPKEGALMSFKKIGRRKALAIARINIGVVMYLNERGIVDSMNIAPGSVFPSPDLVPRASDILIGNKPTKELIEKVGDRVADEMVERSGIRHSTEYKKPAIRELTIQAIEKALEEGI